MMYGISGQHSFVLDVITSHLYSENVQVALSFFQVFLQTMFREWDSIDKLRLDKFMMLVRKFIQGVFRLLLDHGWCAVLIILDL